MDNLEIASFESFRYDRNITGDPVEVSAEDNVCCFISNSSKLNICEYIDNIQTFSLDENIKNTAIQVKYLSIWEFVFIATRSNLLIYNPKIEKVVVVHSFTTKITCTSWNPNETLLVVIDEKNQLYGFTLETNTTSDEYNFIESQSAYLDGDVPNSVYVGWGAHNTQFKGAKKKKDEEEKIEELVQQYSPPVISWRGNGEQFVINFWREYRRFLKVFDSCLRPLFQSEPYANLLPPTSFKGQGNFIACAAQHNEKNKIVIFEKNCLMKSEFFISENRGQVKYLQYHPDLHILAVYSEEMTFNGYLNIYLNCNARWYLKQQLCYSSTKKLISFHWSTFLDKTMCTLNIFDSEAIERILFRVIINRYPENRLVAVIDGVTVYFTKFSDQIVPPPMSSFSRNFDRPVNRIYFDSSINLYQFLTSDKDVHSLVYDQGEFKRPCCLDFPQIKSELPNSSSDVIYTDEKNINNIHYEFVLDRKQDLLVNRTVVCHNVLSMYVHENYLLFTHASCKLYCVRLTTENLVHTLWNLNKFYSREIEQGSKIVCVTGSSDIVLELPRGNLEAVTCRIIAIDSIEKLLAENKWKDAMDRIRQERLSWNLLIDLNPERFSEHIKEFLKSAKTISILNTIVSEFSKEDCLQIMYKQCIDNDRTFFDFDKIQIFAKILDQIILMNPVLNLISIVTLQAKHFSLKSALKSVCLVFERGELEICKKAVFQILLHSHVKGVISDAFTLYNVGFMTFIYTCCNEDPRIFEPELEKLMALESIELRFRMNVLGKNYKNATKYLIRCPKYDEQYISDFVTKYVTQSVAYESIRPDHPQFKLISQLFAGYLALRARYSEAGLILERAGLYEEALKVYKKAFNWSKVLSLLETCEFDENTKQDELLTFARDLVNHKKIDEAVSIYEYNCHAHDKAIEVLTEQKMFQKALNLARKYYITDVIENFIKPAIIRYRVDLSERISELGNKFLDYAARLQFVRQRKCQRFKYRYLDEEEAFENDDLYSEYGSIISSRGSSSGSRSSKGSTLSTRNRRKQEKKKIDLREGGVYEDIALIRQLYLLAVDIFECGLEVQEISMTLTDDESFNFYTMLHEKLGKVQDDVKDNIPKIWSDTFLNAPESTEPDILAVIQNRAELDAEFRNPPSPDKMADNWKLYIFTKK